MYKLIILIISSPGTIYEEFKRLQLKYLKLYETELKFFFVEFKNDINQDIIIDDYNIYIKGSESINPGMIIKTCKAINWINQNYEYEILLRTNLSTLLNLENIFKFIDLLPKKNSFGGFSFCGFITGTGIFMSKYDSEILVSKYEFLNLNNINEDVLISQCLASNNSIYYNPVPQFKWALIINNRDVIISEGFLYYQTDSKFIEFEFDKDILHYRINNSDNRQLDIQYFNFLLKKIYNIE